MGAFQHRSKKKSFINRRKIAEIDTKFNLFQISTVSTSVEVPKQDQAIVSAVENCSVSTVKTSEQNPERLTVRVTIADTQKPFLLEYSYKTAGIERKAEYLSYQLEGLTVKRVN